GLLGQDPTRGRGNSRWLRKAPRLRLRPRVQGPRVYAAAEQDRRQAGYCPRFGAAGPEATHARQRQGSSSRAIAGDPGPEEAGPEAVTQSSAGGLQEKERGQRLTSG